MGSPAQAVLIDALRTDWSTADLGAPERAMLAYASKLTRDPSSVTADDVKELREQGFDDRAVHDICTVTAYFAFVNRIADGLGVELEDEGG